ncbi:pyridoxamine 5'-phosphate oxidase family protein [Paenibacillus sp. BSR1-1]|uniref:pyridoxamine 5'-phosphate oxidase family protein n=1 Tax=Paenibacillus sp. BSR1-1 TaxID=3020845 RepID=UPI0025B127A9|nr:pyridoxamine 5'-phosphate oxidase family protein [Paenibacillus sp. BSR1-1]MDN3015245.1 pyridoxamine 5'-phosphate oxidase family protein [Paenibacillus sp. BSR1-1]
MIPRTLVFKDVISTFEELRSLIGTPSERAEKKVIHFIDKHCQNFISLSPFLVMSTADKKGNCDVSPRGDQPGFVMVLNEKQLLIPERPGNKRVDSMKNIIENPHVGLQFLIPGLGETLRINGKACLVKDDELLEKVAVNGKKPLLGIGVEAEECFIHCAKAILRSGLWKPETWKDKAHLPRAAKILAEHANIEGVSVDEVEASLIEGYKKRLY